MGNKTGWRPVAPALSAFLLFAAAAGGDSPLNAPATFKQYCFQCHGKTAMAGVNLEQLTAQASFGHSFQQWEKAAAALEQGKMPPKGAPQPGELQRRQAVSWIRSRVNEFARKHDGDPGRVTLRRLTSGEYSYTIRDLTGLDMDIGRDFANDTVGGEGFTNFGDVQFIEDATLERYLEMAKLVANHAVIGAGPLEFFGSPGKTGFELSAISRIRNIYAANGFRTVSGEGGRPFGLEKYGKAFYAAWRYQHRSVLGDGSRTLAQIATREGISARFAEHIWSVLHNPSLGYPGSEVAARWRNLPVPAGAVKAAAANAQAGCEAIQKFLVTWPSWLFARGDYAAGGAGDESPLVFNDDSLKVDAVHRFTFNSFPRFEPAGRGEPTGPEPKRIYLNISSVTADSAGKPVVIWRNPAVVYRMGSPERVPSQNVQPTPRRGGSAGPRQSLRSVVSEETAKRLAFGQTLDGAAVGAEDFAANESVSFEVPLPKGAIGFEFHVDAAIGPNRDQVIRILISDQEDGRTRGAPTRALLGDPQSAGYKAFKNGVLELARLLPPNSHGEPTPADKDPIPEPFDNTYNVPEHDEFIVKVKYHRDDRFLVANLLDAATRLRLENAWSDLYLSFEYHDNYLRMIAAKLGVDLQGKRIGEMDMDRIQAMPAEARKYVIPLRAGFDSAMAAQAAGRRGHVEDCIHFAARAWRRPLSERERESLRAFYDTAISSDPDHVKAIRALLARILIAPAFLYRVEQSEDAAGIRPLSNWELASRLSFFLWSSIPDEELRRAAGGGELSNTQQLQRQVKRMLADPKARRLSTEFFGQWLGFYNFNEHRGVDTGRFPEFTNDVKEAMYDEAVSFFEHIIRRDRPAREILFADYTFLNKSLAGFYGVKKEIDSRNVQRVDGANSFHRGGLLRLGAVLTTTSAPLRTSPVKRGDWILRRVLGTAVPPPPADAGSIPADDKLFGGLSLREKLEAHKRNAACANCHSRIDGLGFSLERYDSTGRWRDLYPDGKPIDDSGELSGQTRIAGVAGLLDYLRVQENQVLRTLSSKLLGYALGRTILASDQPLIERLASAGGDAGFSQFAAGIATSKQFRSRLGREDREAAVAAIKQ